MGAYSPTSHTSQDKLPSIPAVLTLAKGCYRLILYPRLRKAEGLSMTLRALRSTIRCRRSVQHRRRISHVLLLRFVIFTALFLTRHFC